MRACGEDMVSQRLPFCLTSDLELTEGPGYGIQRNIMRLTKNESNSNDLWTKQELLRDRYDPGIYFTYRCKVCFRESEDLTRYTAGTVATNHFLMVDKSPSSITFRACLGPKQSPPTPQELDNFCELTATLNKKRQEVEFRMKCITFDGTDPTAREDPYGGFPGLLHRQYAKLLVESAVSHCVR